jgi:signal transduction histidine kinase
MSLIATPDDAPETYLPTLDWARLESRGHSVQFYEDDAFLLDGLSRFVGGALGAGDAAVVIATEAHRHELIRRLAERGLDTTLAMKRGRFALMDAAETLAQFMRDGRPETTAFTTLIGSVLERARAAASNERPRVAAFGEMVALLVEDECVPAAIELEQLWNTLAEAHEFYLHCAYPLRLFACEDDIKPMGMVCAEHARVIPADSYTGLPNGEERMRAITILQQKARALETEIEARKQLEQALVERNQALNEALAARDEFLSVAAHELRTPVTTLRLIAQGLLRTARHQRDITPDRLSAVLDTLELQTDRISQLVARLLDRAQLEAGKLRIDPVRTDLLALIQSTLAQRGDAQTHKIVFNRPEHLEAVVDPLRFEQVITNLVDNAIKFSPEGSTVSIDVTIEDGVVRIAVTDEGIGIPPDKRETIFDRFSQAHSRRHASGMGLGLYITREIVSLHGGTVHVEEPDHTGSRFVITLPASQPA